MISASLVGLWCHDMVALATELSKRRVAAATDLKFALDEVVDLFQVRHLNIKVQVTYGSSGNFYAQLSRHAPFDIFLSADVDYPRRLIREGLAPASDEFV